MRTDFRISSLVPSGLAFDSVSDSTDSIILTVRSKTGVADCPLCGTPSRRVHSRYLRHVADLPCAGREVRLRMITRRFVCEVPHCRRRIFAERFEDDVVPIRARRTARLERIVHHLGLALGGRPAAGFAKRLMLPVSNDTLLRVVRRRTVMPSEPLIVVGIDDWAFRRNHRYGTIVCDLERRRIVALLPDREMATVQAWLSGNPEVRVVSRDRGGGYGRAWNRAAPSSWSQSWAHPRNGTPKGWIGYSPESHCAAGLDGSTVIFRCGEIRDGRHSEKGEAVQRGLQAGLGPDDVRPGTAC